jgi:hypothetical protein
MLEIINHINQRLDTHNLQLNSDNVLAQHQLVMNRWTEIVESLNGQAVRFLIIGEATVSWGNYFYNEEANTTSFLTPAHFGCANKAGLINLFNENGVLIFDLYPLPLPTFVYDNVTFDTNDSVYKQALVEYYQLVSRLINEDTVIVPRYSKLYNNRQEWNVFMNTIGRNSNQFESIASQNMGANQDQIATIFNDII